MKKPIRILSPSIELLAEIDNYQSMFFIRRWHGIGEIQIKINRYKKHTDKLLKGNLILVGSHLNKVFIIKHREIELDENGKATENWLIKGLALKVITGQRVIIPPQNQTHDSITGDTETVMKHYLNNHIINPVDANRKIDLVTNAANQNRGPQLAWQARLTNLAEDLANISLNSGLGWNMILDVQQKKFIFDVAEGRNLTANQSVNPPVIFSPQFDSLKSLSYTESDLNYKNVGIVGGQGEGDTRNIVQVGNATGLNRHEIFINASNDEAPALTGERTLKEYEQEIYLEGQILTKSPFVYEKDYDLGDIVTIQNKDWGVTMDARITEIKEIYETSGFKIEATFGNNRPTLIQKIKQELSQISGEIRK